MQDAAGLVTLALQPPLRAVHTVCAGPGKSSWLVCSPASAHPRQPALDLHCGRVRPHPRGQRAVRLPVVGQTAVTLPRFQVLFNLCARALNTQTLA